MLWRAWSSSIYKSDLEHFPSQTLQKTKRVYQKKFLIFSEMELFSSNIEKIIIFSLKKAFLIFPKTKPCTFQSKLKTERKRKRKPWKKNPYFSYILGNGTFESKALNWLDVSGGTYKAWNFVISSQKSFLYLIFFIRSLFIIRKNFYVISNKFRHKKYALIFGRNVHEGLIF